MVFISQQLQQIMGLAETSYVDYPEKTCRLAEKKRAITIPKQHKRRMVALYKAKVEFLIRGDKHTHYLNESNRGKKKNNNN